MAACLSCFGGIAVALICGLALCFYVYVKKRQSYWQERGVKCVKPRFFFGIVNIFRSKSFSELVQDVYNEFPEDRYHGTYQMLTPLLMIRDANLIKQITVKEFDHFVNHRQFVDPEVDRFWGRNLLTSRDDRWRHLRSTLSPSFTGSKMRLMYKLMDECAAEFVRYFREGADDVTEVDVKDATARYTNDVIATTAFGLKCDSLKDRTDEFYLMGKDASDFGGFRFLRLFAASMSPTLAKLFNIKVVPTVVTDYFSKIIEEAVKTREDKSIVRPDMLHLLMEARKGRHLEEGSKSSEGFSESDKKKEEITLEDITSQAIIFFLAGFESVSILLCFALYELAVHPQVQERLREEINSMGEEITYDTLLSLKYLDAVVSETLRKWPPTPLTDRQVSRPFTIQPERPGEKPLLLEEGVVCCLAIYPIHRDPNNYPGPDRFDPDRFGDENRHNVDPATYLPFGAGPRNCIGSRFALLESKLLLSHLLKNFEMVPIARTHIPMVLDKNQLNLTSKGGMWLGMKKLRK